MLAFATPKLWIKFWIIYFYQDLLFHEKHVFTNFYEENYLLTSNESHKDLTERQNTVWTIQKFPYIQILREINFRESRSSKTAILTLFEDLNFDFEDFFIFWGMKLTKIEI